MVPVEIGLNDGTNVEIKSGLTEGQEIIVSVVSNSTSSSSTSGQKSGNPFGGGGSSMGNLNRATSTGGGNRGPSGATGAPGN
jgi:HlyD family secretion protein